MRRVFGILMVVALCGCTLFVDKVTDVSQQEGYREVAGKEFKTLQPTVLYKLDKRKDDIEMGSAGKGGVPELKELEGKSFPYEAGPYVYVQGVLPATSMFRVDKVIYRRSFEDSYVRYVAVVTSEGPFKGMKIDPTWLTDLAVYPKVPQFDPKFVKGVEMK